MSLTAEQPYIGPAICKRCDRPVPWEDFHVDRQGYSWHGGCLRQSLQEYADALLVEQRRLEATDVTE